MSYNLHVDGSNAVVDWNHHPDNLGHTPEGWTKHEDVETPDGEDPDLGDTYDGTTYTRKVPPDYFVVKQLGNPLPDWHRVTIARDGVTTKTFVVQKCRGADDAAIPGEGETIKIEPQGGLVKIDKSSVTLDGVTGSEAFVVGPYAVADGCGCVPILFKHTSLALPARRLILDVVD